MATKEISITGERIRDGDTNIDLPHRLHFSPCSLLLHVHGKQLSRNRHIRFFGPVESRNPLQFGHFLIPVPF